MNFTKKLFYNDAYTQTFTTNISKVGKDTEGSYVVLEETAFYPTGGGQPADKGWLNGVEVMNVEEKEGEIRHYLAQLLDEGEKVDGKINWDRRFDHMQQHAGQHILSAAFAETFQYQTISFHLGKEIVSIDLDIEDVTDEELERVENVANQIILENREIETVWVEKEDLYKYPLRKETTVSHHIRLVIIPSFDYNGCGGTHPSSTGEVSAIKILGTERHKKKTRIYFVCGARVLQQLHQKNKVLNEATKLLSAPEEDVAQTIKKLLVDMKSLQKQLEVNGEQLLQFEARQLMTTAKTNDNCLVVGKVFLNRSISELQWMAKWMTAEKENNLIVFINETEDKLQCICASGTQVDFSMKEICSKLLLEIKGKGGGNQTFAQGGGERSVEGKVLLDKALSYVI
ncbi:DHHA1 domain-containing protein [Cytobacillus sp. FSL K6-0129]|uniref:alanyl-tRNA editing protein n=1 Tax=Cytobacillus sp. FSL K6-0129 TaxID=2921421 RepID=UPI0030FCFECE